MPVNKPVSYSNYAVLLNAAFAGLERLADRDNGGFFDALAARGVNGFKLKKSKKANYNSACLIALADVAPETRLARETASFLLRSCEENDFVIPTYPESGSRDFTWGEQGLALWALSKALRKKVVGGKILGGKNTAAARAARGACDCLFEKILAANGCASSGRSTPLSRYSFVPMETAFCLDGLTEYFLLTGSKEAKKACLETALFLVGSWNGGAFEIKRSGTVANRVSFNNYAYPIHALSRFFLLVEQKERVKKVLREAVDFLLANQGDEGEWWWTYDARGAVVMHYPVYSVHQDGMAPMALRFAAKIFPEKKGAIESALSKSFSWVYGKNVLRERMIDVRGKTIWRSIRCPWFLQKLRQVTGFTPETLFSVKKECRSYHLAWALYASRI